MQDQLWMAWPSERRSLPPAVIPTGYTIRPYTPADKAGFLRLMDRVFSDPLGYDYVFTYEESVISDCWLVAVHDQSGEIVANTVAMIEPVLRYDEFWRWTTAPMGIDPDEVYTWVELNQVGTDPDHRRHGLARALCTLVTARLLDLGWQDIYLRTEDMRLWAIQMYLNLGYVPSHPENFEDRWSKVFARLDALQKK